MGEPATVSLFALCGRGWYFRLADKFIIIGAQNWCGLQKLFGEGFSSYQFQGCMTSNQPSQVAFTPDGALPKSLSLLSPAPTISFLHMLGYSTQPTVTPIISCIIHDDIFIHSFLGAGSGQPVILQHFRGRHFIQGSYTSPENHLH